MAEDLGRDYHKLDATASVFEPSKFAACDFRQSFFSDVIFDNCDFSNTRFVEMSHCDMTESSISDTVHKNWNASECLFMGTNFFRTKLKNFDFTSCELENIIISDTLEEIRGAKITATQALEAARLLGMKVV